MTGQLVVLSAVAVIVALGVAAHRLGGVLQALDDLHQQRQRQPTGDELNRWMLDLQSAVTIGLKETRSSNVQLRQTEALVRRIEQIERINASATTRVRRPGIPDQLDPRHLQ